MIPTPIAADPNNSTLEHCCGSSSIVVFYFLLYSLSSAAMLLINWNKINFSWGLIFVSVFAAASLSGIPPSPIFFLKLSVLGLIGSSSSAVFVALALFPLVLFWFFLLNFLVLGGTLGSKYSEMAFIWANHSSLISITLFLLLFFPTILFWLVNCP